MVNELVEVIGLLKLGYTKQALNFLSKLLHKNLNKEKRQEILNKLYSFALELINQQNYKVALQLLKLLEDLSADLKDSNKLCDIKNNLSYCFRVLNFFNESLTKCLEALEVVTQHSEIRGKLPALHLNACAIYREDLHDLKNAKTHAELAYYFAKETYSPTESCKRNLAVSMYNYAFISDELNDFKTSEKWYKEALSFCESEWNDKILIDNLQYKLRQLHIKQRLVGGRIKATDISNMLHAAKRSSNSAQSPYNNHSMRRRLMLSQCAKRTKNYSPNSSTPVPRTSISSHEKSTDNSVYSHEPVFKPRSIRVASKRIIVKGMKNMNTLVKELSDEGFDIKAKVISIQSYFRGYLCRKRHILKKNIIAKKKLINKKRYLIFLTYIEEKFIVEAFNTESVIQINKQTLKLRDVCESLNIPHTNWKKYIDKIFESIIIERRCISFRQMDETIVYEGLNYLNGEKFNISIKFIDAKEKCLRIMAKNEQSINTYTFPLDLLQDPENVKNKIPYIISKLKMKDGELKFCI